MFGQLIGPFVSFDPGVRGAVAKSEVGVGVVGEEVLQDYANTDA